MVPGEPTDLAVIEATKSYVVLSWKPPAQRGHEGVMYYIEKVRESGLEGGGVGDGEGWDEGLMLMLNEYKHQCESMSQCAKSEQLAN